MKIQSPEVERWSEIDPADIGTVEQFGRTVTVTGHISISYFVDPITKQLYQRQRSGNNVYWMKYYGNDECPFYSEES